MTTHEAFTEKMERARIQRMVTEAVATLDSLYDEMRRTGRRSGFAAVASARSELDRAIREMQS